MNDPIDSFELPRPKGDPKTPDEAIIGPSFTLLDAGLIGATPSERPAPSSPFEQAVLEPVPTPAPLRMPFEDPRRRDEWSMLDQRWPEPSGGGASAVMSLLVQEVDGTPSVNVATIKVRNGCLTDEGGGVARLNAIGTEAEAVLTPGSVVFAGAGGLLQQDNANFSWDDSLDRLTIGTGSLTINGKAGQATVFNESGVDQDFRVEGDTDTNLFFVDASTDAVGIGLTSGPDTKFHVFHSRTNAGTRVAHFNPSVAITSDGSYAIYGAVVASSSLSGNGVSIATGVTNSGGETGLYIEWRRSIGGNGTLASSKGIDLYAGFASTAGTMTDVRGLNVTLAKSSGTIGTGYWHYLGSTGFAGTLTTAYGLYFNPDSAFATTLYSIVCEVGTAVFNESGGNFDFRIEGDTEANLFFVDASAESIGIGTATPGAQTRIHCYQAGSSAAWRGRGVFSNDVNSVVAGVYGNVPIIGAHDAALTAWSTLYVNTTAGSDGAATRMYALAVGTATTFGGQIGEFSAGLSGGARLQWFAVGSAVFNVFNSAGNVACALSAVTNGQSLINGGNNNIDFVTYGAGGAVTLWSDASQNNVGIRSIPTTDAVLYILDSMFNASGYGIDIQMQSANNAVGPWNTYGVRVNATYGNHSASNTGHFTGFHASMDCGPTTNQGDALGFCEGFSAIIGSFAGTSGSNLALSEAACFKGRIDFIDASSTLTNAYGLYISAGTGGGTITTSYGAYINPLAGTTTYGIVIIAGHNIFNEDGGDYDFRVEGDADVNLLFGDASTDRVGIGTNAPSVKLDVNGGVATRATTNAQITADTNDYAIGAATFFRLSTDAQRTVTGLTGGVDGKVLIIRNTGSFNLVLANQSASSAAANRIVTGTGLDLVVVPGAAAILIYDATDQRWQLV